MGISIHFKGRIELNQIKPLCEELEDIAESAGFQESVWVDDDEKRLKGIILRPASEMESIPFLFDSEGRLHALCDLLAGWNKDPILSVAVKTQFADIKDHIWLVELLRYIKGKYFPRLEVIDEGSYWESADPAELERRIDELAGISKGLGKALENGFMNTVTDKENPESLVEFIERTAQQFQKRRGLG